MNRRVMMALAGVLLCGACVGMMQAANLGVDPFTCFVTGIAKLVGSTYATCYFILTGILLVDVLLVQHHRLGVTTVLNLVITGWVATATKDEILAVLPHPSLAGRSLLLAVALVLSCLAAALYFTADLGVSAYDAWALIAGEDYHWLPFKVCRIITDLTCVTVGFLCGVIPGVGTVITALMMGPLTQWFRTHLAEPLLARPATA